MARDATGRTGLRIGRRRLLAGLAALAALPAGLRPAPAAAAVPSAAALPAAGFRMVNGWILTERDVSAIAALRGDSASAALRGDTATEVLRGGGRGSA